MTGKRQNILLLKRRRITRLPSKPSFKENHKFPDSCQPFLCIYKIKKITIREWSKEDNTYLILDSYYIQNLTRKKIADNFRISVRTV